MIRDLLAAIGALTLVAVALAIVLGAVLSFRARQRSAPYADETQEGRS